MKLLVAALFMVFGASIATACGNPRTGTQTGTAAVNGSPTVLPPGPEFLDDLNRRYAAHGEPTLPLGTDISHGYPYDKTAEAIVDATDEARPTHPPGPLFCGPADARSGDIVMNHGPVRANCARYGDDWITTTSGDPSQGIPGILALYRCDGSDASCLSLGEPRIPGKWQIYTAPTGEGVTIYSQSGPILLILPGQYCFDLTTRAWVLPCDWDGVLRANFTAVPATPPAP
jgi:hypothetical protein